MRNTLLFLLALLVFWQCAPGEKNALPAGAKPLLTHKEAADTLRADTTLPLKPYVLVEVPKAQLSRFFTLHTLDSLFLLDYPDNGFFGESRHRIEFIFTEMAKSPTDPAVYLVGGKNRHKGVISNFSGLIRLNAATEITDPNLDAESMASLQVEKIYSAAGDFEFREDTALGTSGVFRGRVQVEFGTHPQMSPQLWFYSDNTPARGSGYRFDGEWTSYHQSLSRPVIWSRDLFRFANDILENFSYGEREIQINPKYRELGWDSFWDGEEWWHDTPAVEML
jgi:hypothetical protein